MRTLLIIAMLCGCAPGSDGNAELIEMSPTMTGAGRWEQRVLVISDVSAFEVCTTAGTIAMRRHDGSSVSIVAVAPDGERCIDEMSGAFGDLVLQAGVDYSIVSFSDEAPIFIMRIGDGMLRVPM